LSPSVGNRGEKILVLFGLGAACIGSRAKLSLGEGFTRTLRLHISKFLDRGSPKAMEGHYNPTCEASARSAFAQQARA